MVLAQVATDAKSNEITAVPKLLVMLSLKGTIVTAGALNCQRSIAEQIVNQGGNYALALKENQPTLHAGVDVPDERGSSNDPTRQRAAQFGCATAHGAECLAEGPNKGVTARRAGWNDAYLTSLLALF